MRIVLAALLLLSLMAGCFGSESPPPSVTESPPVPEPLAVASAPAPPGPCDRYNETHSPTAPYHESTSDHDESGEAQGASSVDYCSSPWDPLTLRGYDERYRPSNDRSDGSPYGVHLSFADDPQTTLTVTWFTAFAAVDVQPSVRWGVVGDPGQETIEAQTSTAYPGDPAVAETNPVDVAVHSATITGLKPGQRIWYQVEGTTGSSDRFSAHTDPGPGATVRVLHWGDQAVTRDESKRTVGFALKDLPDLVIIAGDLSYANGEQWIWDDYFWYFEPLFARVPIMAVVGNHEAKDGELFDGFRSRMALPNDEIQYGFQYGPAYWTMIDTEGAQLLAPGVAVTEGDPEGALASVPDSPRSYQDIVGFLQAGYDAKQAGDLAWSMVVQHVPPCSNHESRGNAYQLTALEEPWFLAFEVDLVMAGHNHMYERSTPMIGCKANPEGWVEIINGGGGQSLYEFVAEGEFQDWSAAHAARTAVVEYVIHPDELYGYTYATDDVANRTWELIDSWEIELGE